MLKSDKIKPNLAYLQKMDATVSSDAMKDVMKELLELEKEDARPAVIIYLSLLF